VRPEAEAAPVVAAETAQVTVATTAEVAEETGEESGEEPLVVSDFEAIDALLEQAVPEAPSEPVTPQPEAGLGEAG
jgi:hypothetical protein